MQFQKQLTKGISGQLRRSWVTQKQASYPVLLALLSAPLFQGCPSRDKAEAAAWLNNGLPADVCEREPSLQDHGFYRRLDNGNFEFISFCKPEVQHWISFLDTDLEKLLNITIPDTKP